MVKFHWKILFQKMKYASLLITFLGSILLEVFINVDLAYLRCADPLLDFKEIEQIKLLNWSGIRN